MASYNELLALIDAYINRNGVQAITGQILNGVLKAMVDQLGRGYTLMGYAEPTGDPGTPDGPESWFASVPGTYTNYGEIQVAAGELALLSFAPSEGWTKNTIYEGFREVTADIDGNVGTPEVGVSYANGVLSFDFRNMKGNPGEDGDPAGFGSVTASVDDQVGTPSVSVSSSGPDTAKNFAFAFHNLKGETGVTSVVATVDNTSGNPQCSVSLQGGQLTLAFTGLKGAQGNTGSSVDYPFTIVNNLTTDDPTQALSAAMGVELDGKVSQLEAKVGEISFSEDSAVTTITENYYINGNNGQSYASANNDIVNIDVTNVTRVRFTGLYMVSAGTSGYAFYDEDDAVLASFIWDYGASSQVLKEYVVVVPTGAKTFRASRNKGSYQISDYSYYVQTGENVSDRLNGAETLIEQQAGILRGQVNGTSSYNQYYEIVHNISLSSGEGFRFKITGTKTSSRLLLRGNNGTTSPIIKDNIELDTWYDVTAQEETASLWVYATPGTIDITIHIIAKVGYSSFLNQRSISAIEPQVAELQEKVSVLEDETIYIKHFGTARNMFNDWVDGDFFYNTNAKTLIQFLNVSQYPNAGSYRNITLKKKANYIWEKNIFVFDGVELVPQEIAEENRSSNLYNPDTLTPGYIKEDGTTGSSDSYSYTDYIRVSQGDVIFATSRKASENLWGQNIMMLWIAAFDLSGVIQPSLGTNTVRSYTVPSGVAYIRITFTNTSLSSSEFRINVGTEKEYESYFNGVAPLWGYETKKEVLDIKKNPYSSLPSDFVNNLSYKRLGTLSKGYICLTCDDGRHELATYTIPMIIDKEVPCTFAVMSASEVFTNQSETEAVVSAVTDHDCAIAQHGGYEWDVLEEWKLREFLSVEDAFWQTLGIHPTSAVCPGHKNTALVRAIMGGKFGVVRSGYHYGGNYYGNYMDGPTSNLFALSSVAVEDVSLANHKAAIDEAIANHYIRVIHWHEAWLTNEQKQLLEDVIDYAKASGITFCTLGDIPKLI